MSKGMDRKKDEKKKPIKTLKEKIKGIHSIVRSQRISEGHKGTVVLTKPMKEQQHFFTMAGLLAGEGGVPVNEGVLHEAFKSREF